MMKKLVLFGCCFVTVHVSAIFDLSVVNKKQIVNCQTGDDITTVNGQYNQVQVVRASCDSSIGSTDDAIVFAAQELPRWFSSVTTTKGINDITLTLENRPKIIGYEVTKDGKMTRFLLQYTTGVDGNARLITYTSMPWAGQVERLWTRHIEIPFTIPLAELKGNILLRFNERGILKLILGDESNESLQFAINLFNPRAV